MRMPTRLWYSVKHAETSKTLWRQGQRHPHRPHARKAAHRARQNLRPQMPRPYVRFTTAKTATFSFKFIAPETSKRRTGWLGLYNLETYTVEHARRKIYALRGTGAVTIADTAERKSVVAQSRRSAPDYGTFRGRDASYLAPPAQIRTGPIRAYGSHLGCLTAKRLS